MRKTRKTIEVGGQTIAVEIYGRESDTVWLFLHGWGSRKEVWRQVVQNFPSTTVTVDLPGFGASNDLSEPLATADYSRIITDVITELGFDSVVLVGHSFGGQVGASLAAEKPGWLKGLVLVGASVIRDERPSLLADIGSFLSPLFQLPGLNWLRPKIYKMIGADMPPEDENLKQTMRTVLRDNQTHHLEEITVPTKIIWGRSDKAVPVSHAQTITSLLPTAELSVLAGGHFVFLDNPEVFMEEIASFKARLS